MSVIVVRHKDKQFEYERGVSLLQVSKDLAKYYEHDILVGSVNNKLRSQDTKLNKNCTVSFYDISSITGSLTYQRGIQFLFSKAVRDILNCDVKIMHMLDKTVYCEILTNNLISEVTTEKIKIRMKELVRQEIPINKIMVSRIEAIDYYEKINQTDKANSLRFISNSSISLFKMDDTLDYFYGMLPYNTKVLKDFNLKYLKDNKVVLLFHDIYDLKSDLKFNKNEKLLSAIERNDMYLQCLDISTSVELNKNISTGKYGDLIRISESLQNNRLIEISDNISKNKDIKMVLITGPSSSGKTTTSKKLTLYLKSKGLKPVTISVDDFYIDMKDRVLDKNGNPEYERIEAIDTSQFNKKISDLISGKEVFLPKYNFVLGKQEISAKPIKLKENSILIIEGIHAFNEQLTEMIPDKNKFKLFICPLTPLNIDNHNLFKQEDNRLLRRIIRDNKKRGATATDTLKLWKTVREAEEEFIIPYMKEADEIFNTSLIYELGVLKTYAEPLLFSVNEDDENYEEAIRLINLFRVILGIPSDDVLDDSIIREFIGGSCFKD